MKTKRFVSTLLALLLICSLPVSAFADDNYGNTLNTGTIDTNYGNVINYGTVKINEGNISVNYSGTVETNNNYVGHNSGTVETNKGTVNSNHDTVETNNGTVNSNLDTVDTNNGTVEKNYGTVNTNNGTVEKNYDTMDTNNGTVEKNYGTVDTNNGTVDTNYKTVFKNGTETNHDKAIVETNNHHVDKNFGTVGTNNGTVDTNEITGTVTNRYYGAVRTNYGTVNEADGTTHYGVQVDNDGAVTLEQKESGQALDFSQLTKEGYELTGYTQAYGMENGKVTLLPSPITVNETSYTADCPNVLTLIWQAIVNPGSGEIAAAASDGTGSFGPGSVISISGHKFLLVAVVEDVYCLAFVDSFEQEQLSDLSALLSSLLTEEQLSHVTGEPELLDEELTARLFGGQGSHIVFPCDNGLIFH